MQYLKLTRGQKAIKRWEARRNQLLQKILEKDKYILRHDAIQKANQEMQSSHPASKANLRRKRNS